MTDGALPAAEGALGRFRDGPWPGRLVRALLLVVGVSPLLPGLFGVIGLSPLSRPFDWWFEFQCHRESARSLSLAGHVLPVCSRCFGIYSGLGLGALLLRPRLDVWPLRIWVGLAALVMLLDVATELLGMRPEWAPLRVATGIFLSYPVGVSLVWAARPAEPPPGS